MKEHISFKPHNLSWISFLQASVRSFRRNLAMPSLESSSSVQLPANSGNLVACSSHKDNNSITSSTTTGGNSVTMKPISAQWTHSTNGHGVNNSTSYPNNHQIKFTRGDQTLNRNHSATSSFGVGNINGSPNGLSANSTSSTSSTHQQGCQADPMTYNGSSSAIDLPSSTYFSRNGNSMKEQNLDEKQQFLVVNNQKMESHYAHLSINKNRRDPMSQQHVFEYMPSLISLDSNDLTRPLFCYTLQPGKFTNLKNFSFAIKHKITLTHCVYNIDVQQSMPIN